jgi:flagellar motor switch protein FliN/FliY
LPGEGNLVPDDVEFLLSQAQRALASVDSQPHAEPPPGVTAFRLEEFAGAPASTEVATLDLIRDVEMDLRIELGRTHLYLEDVLKLRRGSVVPLDKMAGDPVDIFVNGRLIGRGEVLVLNDSFCVRVAELIAGTPPAG